MAALRPSVNLYCACMPALQAKDAWDVTTECMLYVQPPSGYQLGTYSTVQATAPSKGASVGILWCLNTYRHSTEPVITLFACSLLRLSLHDGSSVLDGALGVDGRLVCEHKVKMSMQAQLDPSIAARTSSSCLRSCAVLYVACLSASTNEHQRCIFHQLRR